MNDKQSWGEKRDRDLNSENLPYVILWAAFYYFPTFNALKMVNLDPSTFVESQGVRKLLSTEGIKEDPLYS